MMKKVKIDNGIILGLVISLLLIWVGFYFSYPDFSEIQKRQEERAQAKKTEQEALRKNLAFGKLNIEAKAYVIYDLETGKLIAGKKEQEVLPLASITKVMTILVASENSGPETSVSINPNVNGNGILRPGETWSLANLAALTLVGSSNDGATAIAGANQSQGNFVNQMNARAQELGLNDLRFSNPTGLDEGATPGGKGSALSVAKLFSYIIKSKPEILTATREALVREKSLDDFDHTILNTNKIVNAIPGLLGSKTGYTDLAGGNLAIVANLGLNRPIAIVVLGSSEEGRFTDTKKLIGATLNYYSNS